MSNFAETLNYDDLAPTKCPTCGLVGKCVGALRDGFRILYCYNYECPVGHDYVLVPRKKVFEDANM